MTATIKAMSLPEILGWIGMILLQSQSIPAVFATVSGGASIPISLPIMCFLGLACYMARAMAQKDVLYMVGNGIGLLGQFVLICAIIYS